MNRLESITALATPPGEGGLAVVRISGPQAVKILGNIFSSQHGIDVAKMATHKLYHGFIKGSNVDGEEVLVTVMRAPRSYTGEDVAEIFAHGGILVSQEIIRLIVGQGARLAEPGEFTKRAFLNGKIDLSQAEAVADVIAAKTETALKIGLSQLGGKLSTEIKIIKKELLEIIAHLEAGIDYAEEEVESIETQNLRDIVTQCKKHLDQLIITYVQGRVIKNGVKVAIIGRPNVGKSSLLNCLLREERAIVTEIPGTTRDVIEDIVNIKGIPVRLMDTAGVRDSRSIVEKRGLEKTDQAIKKADLLLWVIDGSKPYDKKNQTILKKIVNKPVIIVINKTDLPIKMIREEFAGNSKYPIAFFSAKTGKGLAKLEEIIEQQVLHHNTSQSEQLIITSERQYECLRLASKSLYKALTSISKKLSPEFIIIDLKKSMTHIGELVGDIVNEDILKVIFSKFCIGK